MAEIKRRLTQLAAAVFFNSYTKGFKSGTIYRGNLKQICVPVLNCYSCPGAIGSCPIGSFQSVAAGITYQFSFYVAGFLTLIGLAAGKMACGWICPFGLFQEILYRIPSPKYFLPVWTRCLKYALLIFLVLLLPALAADPFGIGTPYFCKWLCPAGTLEAAIPLALTNEGIRGALGALFKWRLTWLLAILIFCVVVERAFCQALCPLGAIYSLFNRISFFSIHLEHRLCSRCGRCSEVCYIRLSAAERPNHPECMRCLKCVKNCPTGALNWVIEIPGKKEKEISA